LVGWSDDDLTVFDERGDNEVFLLTLGRVAVRLAKDWLAGV
jgi:hypothetical protein